MRILVIGCGSIGRRHLRLLNEMMGVELCAMESNELTAMEIQGTFQIPVYIAGEGFPADRIDGAIVATLPHMHRDHAMKVLALSEAGVLVEKPIATTIDDAQGLVEWFRDTKQPLLVGYNLRFHPGLRRVKELLDSGAIGRTLCARIHCGSYLPSWRPTVDYRTGYAARRDTGGGVILDASHELDYACWLFGEPVAVSCIAQNTGALEIETEDVADLTVTFASGVQAAIHLDYLACPNQRGVTIIGDSGTIEWDWIYQTLWRWSGGEWDCEDHVIERDDMYRAELKHFLACLRGEEQPLCTGEDGLRALRLALAARESAETGRVVRL